jgi:predicted ATPase
MNVVAAPEPLLERSEELARIESALADARTGRGRFVVVEGPAGIGKTALLAAVRTVAAEDGMRVLRSRATEMETNFAFGVVRQLFERPLVEVSELERADLLQGAAGVAAGMIGLPGAPAADAPPSAGVDPSFAILHGLYWLCANLAGAGPLCLVVDDAHWADAASLRVLLDVQAEISAQRVALVIASRPVENPEVQRLLAAIAAYPDCEVLSPDTLSRAAVEELASDQLGAPVADAFVQECLQVSRGNPFYVTELLRSFEPGAHLDPQALRVDGTLSLRRTMAWRLGELGPGATALAQAAAVLGDGCSLRHAAELARLDEAVAAGEAARLEVARSSSSIPCSALPSRRSCPT